MIKRPGRTYKLRDGTNGQITEDMFERLPGWRWSSIQLTWKLLDLSGRLDRKHWEHWALDHTRHAGHYCVECRGVVCDIPQTEDE